MTAEQLETRYAGPEVSPGFLLWQINNKWQAKQRHALLKFNLTHVQFVLLASLTWNANEKGVTQKQLAGFAQTDVMMTSQVVRVLEQKKFLTRTSNPDDTRSYFLKPTKPGIAIVNKAIIAVEEVDQQFFSVLDTNITSLVTMMQLLNR
jgi:DNA-binding MarR family transcriptional regulator